jgi:hypothetical protein
MTYTAAMDSCVMIYIPNFIKTGSGIQKLIRGIHTHTQTAWRLHKPTFIFFSKIRKVG